MQIKFVCSDSNFPSNPTSWAVRSEMETSMWILHLGMKNVSILTFLSQQPNFKSYEITWWKLFYKSVILTWTGDVISTICKHKRSPYIDWKSLVSTTCTNRSSTLFSYILSTRRFKWIYWTCELLCFKKKL